MKAKNADMENGLNYQMFATDLLNLIIHLTKRKQKTLVVKKIMHIYAYMNNHISTYVMIPHKEKHKKSGGITKCFRKLR